MMDFVDSWFDLDAENDLHDWVLAYVSLTYDYALWISFSSETKYIPPSSSGTCLPSCSDYSFSCFIHFSYSFWNSSCVTE